MSDTEKVTTPAPRSVPPHRSDRVGILACIAAAGAALVGLAYLLAGSIAAIDIVFLVGNLLLAVVCLVRLITRSQRT